MAKKRRIYTPEFKAEAVPLSDCIADIRIMVVEPSDQPLTGLLTLFDDQAKVSLMCGDKLAVGRIAHGDRTTVFRG